MSDDEATARLLAARGARVVLGARRDRVTGSSGQKDNATTFRAGIIGNPSAFVLSLPGLGKSTIIRKQFI